MVINMIWRAEVDAMTIKMPPPIPLATLRVLE